MTLDSFFEKFELFAEAPNAVGKMRELILDLAVRGRLVEQDADEESASELMIAIRRHKAVQEIKPLQQGPYEIPGSWLWAKFGEIMISRDSERVPVSKEERATRAKTYDYYGASGIIDKIDGYLFDKTLLLIGEDGANLVNRSTPIAFLATGKYWVNNHAHVLDGISEEFLKYIALYINSVDLRPYVTGSAQPKMNQAKMNSIPVPLPPLAEQKRIVAKVDELMALCDRLEAQQKERETRHTALVQASLTRFTDAPTPANLEFLFHKSYAVEPAELRKAILTLAVQGNLAKGASRIGLSVTLESGSEVEPPLPHDWRMTTLASVCHSVTDGDHLPPPKANIGIPFLVIGDVRWGSIDFSECRYVGSDYYDKLDPIRKPKRGDILYTLVGSFGIPVIVDTDREFCVQRHIGILRPSAEIDVSFLFYSLQSGFLYKQASICATGIAQKTVPLSGLRKLSIPLPPLPEQKRIVAKVEELMGLVDRLEALLSESRERAARLMDAVVAEIARAA